MKTKTRKVSLYQPRIDAAVIRAVHRAARHEGVWMTEFVNRALMVAVADMPSEVREPLVNYAPRFKKRK